MREYTATPISEYDPVKKPFVLVRAKRMFTAEASNLVWFVEGESEDDYVIVASVPGDKYIITSREIE